jgi:PEP-CTERM motif/Domain of unknown function (DUF4082)
MFDLKLRPLLTAAALAGAMSLAGAQTAIVSFTVGSTFGGFSSDETVGWSFAVAAGPGVQVTSLGWWDATPADPLAAAHEVGIWSSTGTLLASVTVQPGDALTGSFRYAAIAPITLTGGSTYIIGGRDLLADGDIYASASSALVMDPSITFGQAARSDAGTGFVFPGILTANSGGRFGPNFMLTAVPEPSTYALMLMGVAAVGLLARRRTRA